MRWRLRFRLRSLRCRCRFRFRFRPIIFHRFRCRCRNFFFKTIPKPMPILANFFPPIPMPMPIPAIFFLTIPMPMPMPMPIKCHRPRIPAVWLRACCNVLRHDKSLSSQYTVRYVLIFLVRPKITVFGHLGTKMNFRPQVNNILFLRKKISNSRSKISQLL